MFALPFILRSECNIDSGTIIHTVSFNREYFIVKG